MTDSLMATAVEAILGAVYLDGGDQALTAVMTTLGLFTHSLFSVTLTPPLSYFEHNTLQLKSTN